MASAVDTILSGKFQMKYNFSSSNLKCLGATFYIKLVKPSQSLEEKLQYEMSNHKLHIGAPPSKNSQDLQESHDQAQRDTAADPLLPVVTVVLCLCQHFQDLLTTV